MRQISAILCRMALLLAVLVWQQSCHCGLFCRHRHVLPYALVGQDFAKQLLQVQQATVLKQEGATQQILRQAAQLLSEDVMENWPTVRLLFVEHMTS